MKSNEEVKRNNLISLIKGEDLNFYQRGLAQDEYYSLVHESDVEISLLKSENKKRTEFIDALEQELCREDKKIKLLQEEVNFLFYKGEKHINDINSQLVTLTKLRSKCNTKDYSYLTGEINALNDIKTRWNNHKRKINKTP